MNQTSQRDFIDLCMELGVLKFGTFKLKSGRESPYFFNAGLFNTGTAIAACGHAYAGAITASGVTFDMLFGPAYKGIPLVTITAAALAADGRNLPFAYNRKEAKDHGEGGYVVGAPLRGRVLIVDDVITAGTAIRECMSLVQSAGATPAGVVLALDRQERGTTGDLSSVQQVEREFGIPVIRVLTLTDLIQRVQAHDLVAVLPAMQSYRERYGV